MLKPKESKKCLHILQVVGNHSLPCHLRSNSAVGRTENPKGDQVVMWLAKSAPFGLNCAKTWVGALCVEMGFTWTFPSNQDATVKLKFELISIKF